jgi:undecaprenyl-diphosphatase
VLRPVGRLVGPRLRFLWDRLTPGELGLELTTSLAVAGVGIYVFVLYTVVLSGDPDPTGLDSEAFRMVNRLHTAAGVDVAKIVSGLGALPTVSGIVVVTGALLLVRRRPFELVALVSGFALVIVGVHVAKAGLDRPRPTHPLVGATGSSFPSVHAAYSAAWVAVALAFTRGLGAVRGATLVLAAIAISAAITRQNVSLRRILRRSTMMSESSDIGISPNERRVQGGLARCAVTA